MLIKGRKTKGLCLAILRNLEEKLGKIINFKWSIIRLNRSQTQDVIKLLEQELMRKLN